MKHYNYILTYIDILFVVYLTNYFLPSGSRLLKKNKGEPIQILSHMITTLKLLLLFMFVFVIGVFNRPAMRSWSINGVYNNNLLDSESNEDSG